ncbi:MAG TPA: ATP-binding protein [Bryobacteraceae bacterium]|nr:ATP-binding protein [Bryobacteraceae bacterium]
MRKRVLIGSGLLLFAILLGLVVWQGSFTTEPAPSSIAQTYAFWAASTLIFLLTVTLGFMLFRTGVKLYIERLRNRPGSQIRSKLVVGALTLSFVPVLFSVLFGVQVLNRNIDKWFGQPAEEIQQNLIQVGATFDEEVKARLTAQGHWLLSEPSMLSPGAAVRFCRKNGIDRITLTKGSLQSVLCDLTHGTHAHVHPTYSVSVQSPEGTMLLTGHLSVDLAQRQTDLRNYIEDYNRLAANRKNIRSFYLLLLTLITLFILFFATWIALFLARQISGPITSLLTAAQQVRQGNLAYRVRVDAIDELATLMHGFNEMTEALEANSRELENRRRFTEAILESIPTGVISLSADGGIQRVNRALRSILPAEHVSRAARIEDLFSREDSSELRYLMNRARRTGVAGSQLEFTSESRIFQLAVTVAALEESRRSGFVVVLEDTTELLRAQKAAAWHEVARRVAHEIKNPLTPIALCADRIARHLERGNPSAETARILRECSNTISREVESVRTLVDEFSQYSRFPAAQPVPSDLNSVIENALDVFSGRLDDITVVKELAADLPLVNIDREQFKRVVVNLVDNAAEAMRDSPVKKLAIQTRAAGEAVEVTVEDTGPGITRDEREKLFLPYFSTKNRGTGLGLAIVNHILSEHGASIRIEDNLPVGARFLIEIPLRFPADTENPPVEVHA